MTEAAMLGRAGERQGRWPRSPRTLRGPGGWFVRTREGEPLGPYPTQFDADVVAALLVAQLEQARDAEACRRVIYNFRHDDRFRRAPPNRSDRGGPPSH